MSIRQLSPELAKKAKDELFEDPNRIQEDLKALKDWIAKQPHLLARTDDQWLIAFLRGCKYSLERSKEKIDLMYTLRTAVPEIALPRDPKDPIIQEIISLGMFLPLRKTMKPDDPCVGIFRVGINDPNKINVVDVACVGQMMGYLRLLNDDQLVVAGQILILDFSSTTLAHMTQMTPSIVKKLTMCGQDSMPVRDKGSHHINTLPGVETVFNIFKLFMNEKSKSRVHIHNKDMDELYKFVPKDILPVEYGGTCGTIPELINYWKKELEDHRDWFLDDMKYKTNETKRVGKPKTSETLFGIEGSFRQLTVD